jgi:membrane-bound lytic murein transglycosylase MltF
VFGIFATFLTDESAIFSQVITQQERLNVVQAVYKKRNQLTEQCMARKNEMREWSEKQLQVQKHSLLESDAHRNATHLLHRAFEIRQEQEDDVSNLCVTKARVLCWL